jgi:hypothetical protein
MDIDYYEKAVISLRDFPGMIGMIGGEPTLHPNFSELCEILNFHIKDKNRKGLWSNTGKKFQKQKEIIDTTFGYINANDHITNEIIHTPILVASEDLINDGLLSEADWQKYTASCWVQATWSATITPQGAYFCEIAGMLDYLFEGNTGWDISRDLNWWKKRLPEYEKQITWACRKCGCQLPLRPRRSTDGVDDISLSNLERLTTAGSPKIGQGLFELFSGGLDSTQIRSKIWYWNKEKSFAYKAKKLFCRIIGINGR